MKSAQWILIKLNFERTESSLNIIARLNFLLWIFFEILFHSIETFLYSERIKVSNKNRREHCEVVYNGQISTVINKSHNQKTSNNVALTLVWSFGKFSQSLYKFLQCFLVLCKPHNWQRSDLNKKKFSEKLL